MTDYQELKRLAEAAKDKQLGTLTIPVSVVLSMVAEIDRLRTQNQALVEALKDAARSLETVSKLAGRATYGNPPIETFMQHHDEVRGYAASRAVVAFESLAQAEGGV